MAIHTSKELQHRPHPLLDECILKVRLFTHLSRLYVIAIASCHVSQDVYSRSRHVSCDATRKVKGSWHKTSLAWVNAFWTQVCCPSLLLHYSGPSRQLPPIWISLLFTAISHVESLMDFCTACLNSAAFLTHSGASSQRGLKASADLEVLLFRSRWDQVTRHITFVAKSSPPTYFSDMSFTPTADAINARVGTGVECCGSKGGPRIHLGILVGMLWSSKV